MRLFKTTEPARCADDEAAAARLRVIAARSKGLPSPHPTAEASSKGPELPEAPETLQ